MTDYYNNRDYRYNQPAQLVVRQYAEEVKLFGKWSYPKEEKAQMDNRNVDENEKDKKIRDTSLKDQMELTPRWFPHSAGRWQKKRFRKAKCPIVERFTNCLMMHGRNSGKKMFAFRIFNYQI